MDFEPKTLSQVSQHSKQRVEFAEPPIRKPLVLLRDTERSLRLKTVEAIAPLLPAETAMNLGESSQSADEFLDALAKIDIDEITDAELKPARILVGLTFIGFGGLMMMFLRVYLSNLHPELSPVAQVRDYWYQYVWFMGLGVAGLAVLAREAMRPPEDE
ncbi:MAG: hypothetical protein HC780_25050 [Leptolyngbyaceae cyanobacterium CSU_1_3]|nr:hypothetical protein [Leptolyngbyaceae cyanobacterium CSU_1_3]